MDELFPPRVLIIMIPTWVLLELQISKLKLIFIPHAWNIFKIERQLNGQKNIQVTRREESLQLPPYSRCVWKVNSSPLEMKIQTEDTLVWNIRQISCILRKPIDSFVRLSSDFNFLSTEKLHPQIVEMKILANITFLALRAFRKYFGSNTLMYQILREISKVCLPSPLANELKVCIGNHSHTL